MKYRSLLLTASAVMAFSFAGCTKTGQSTTSSSPNYTKPDPEDISYSWQAPYENKLKEFKNSDDLSKNSAFDIVDITGNGTPELIISPNTEVSTGCIVYTLEGDELTEIGTIGNCGSLSYCPGNNTIKDEYVGNGFVIGKYLSYTNGQLGTLISYSDNSASASMGAAIKHEINGEDVMLGEYNKAIEPYESCTSLEAGRRFSFGEDTIRYALKYSESWQAVLAPYQKDLCKNKLTEIMGSFDAMDIVTSPAFDLCDLNGDKVPEIIVSNDDDENSGCTVYYFSDDSIIPMEGTYGSYGVFSFDTRSFVFFGNNGGKKTYWSIANAAFSANDYKESDSVVTIGRKYVLDPDSIAAVFE